MKIIEITQENWNNYKNQLFALENKVKNDMIFQGIGDLFFTTGEDIKEYAEDPRHHVYVIVDEFNKVIAQTYLIGAGSHIQGDYSDLPKYYTMGKDFLEYIKATKYENNDEFNCIGSNMYLIKLYAFKYALRKIYGSVDTNSFIKKLETEKSSKTHFDERTPLRRNINKYMSEFMNKNGLSELYRQFYNIDSSFFKNNETEASKAYDSFINASKINVYSKKIDNPSNYYEANVFNTIEVDTYITDPEARRSGLAKILSTLALTKTITEYFENSNNDILYLSVTLHKDNYLSENVAHFLGFKDYIDLERRSNIERKAYLKRIDRHTYQHYLEQLHKKLKYFHNYGNIEVSEEEKIEFEIEKENHDIEIREEINRRLITERFNDYIRTFVENYRDSIYREIPKQRKITQSKNG